MSVNLTNYKGWSDRLSLSAVLFVAFEADFSACPPPSHIQRPLHLIQLENTSPDFAHGGFWLLH